MMSVRRWLAVAAACLFALVSAPQSLGGPAEMGLLESYIGSWRGTGEMIGGAFPETFTCRLTVAKGNQAKINYAGRCSLVNMNISVSGTIAYNDGARRYEAAMSSNAGFTGMAVGRKQGNRITFNLSEQQVDRGGNTVRIGSKITLVADQITVDFEVEFNQSGQILTAEVPFAR